MKMNVLGSELAAVAGAIDPQSVNGATVESDWMDMAEFEQMLAIVKTGSMTASSTVDAKIEQATDSSGTGAKDVTGKAITQLLAAADANKQALINVRAAELDINGGFSFARLSVSVAGGTGANVDGTVLGLGASYAPASDNGLASVAEIVN